MDEANPPARPYHHGNLRSALVEAGYALAVEQGPDALTLRGVTRRAGVSPTAAYRHFADLDRLRTAVGVRALQALAGTIEEHQSAVTAPAGLSRRRQLLEAVGAGYIAFALDQPHAFRVALFGLPGLQHAELSEGAGQTGRTPIQLLTDALTGLAAVGALERDAVSSAAIHCWSSVHGFASLAILGPLSGEPREVQDALAQGLVRDVVDGVLGVHAVRNRLGAWH